MQNYSSKLMNFYMPHISDYLYFYLYHLNILFFLFFYKDYIFPKYPIFQPLGKKRCRKRNNMRKFWKKEDVEEK
jgi:hypothetical protein